MPEVTTDLFLTFITPANSSDKEKGFLNPIHQQPDFSIGEAPNVSIFPPKFMMPW